MLQETRDTNWYFGSLDMEKAGPQRSVRKIHGAELKLLEGDLGMRTSFDPAISRNGLLQREKDPLSGNVCTSIRNPLIMQKFHPTSFRV